MKKTLALILTLCAMLVPVSAKELDTVETTTENVAVEASLLDDVTDPVFGKLVYSYDGENHSASSIIADGDTAGVYARGATTAWAAKTVANDPANENNKVWKLTQSAGYVAITPQIKITNAGEKYITVQFDVYSEVDVSFSVNGTAQIAPAKNWDTITIQLGKQNISNKFEIDIIGYPGAGKSLYLDNLKLFVNDTEPKLNYASKPAEFDKDKGFLVYFNNGKTVEAYNSNIKLLGASPAKRTHIIGGVPTQALYDHDSNLSEADLRGFAVVPTDGVSFKNSDGVELDGNITICADVYNPLEADVGLRTATTEPAWGAWCGIYTNWDWHKAIANTFTNVSTIYHTQGGIKKIGLVEAATKIKYLSFSRAYAYYMPNNRVTVDGKLIDLTGKTTYTFAMPADGFNAYSDGTNTYLAGTAYALADVNGKTFTSVSVAKPTTDDSTEVKTNGIRFTASVSTALRTNATEYGFIAARSSVLGESELTFDFNNPDYSTSYVHAAAYDESTDIYTEKTDDAVSFAGIVTGVDFSKDEFKNEVITVRAYAKLKSAGDKAIYSYGAAVSSSYAE